MKYSTILVSQYCIRSVFFVMRYYNLTMHKVLEEKLSKYFCPDCVKKNNMLFSAINPNMCNLTGSNAKDYKSRKWNKHGNNRGQFSQNSVFTNDKGDTSFSITHDDYKDYTIQTFASGSLEEDDFGRKNIVWFASKTTGVFYKNGILQGTCDGVKFVLFKDDDKIHGFPTSSADFLTHTCSLCGNSFYRP